MKDRPPITLEPIDGWRWRIPAEARPGMRVDGRVYGSPELVAELGADASLEQVANVATLPGIVGASLAMPDIHWGYGFPIGGVAAFTADSGVVSPGGVGYDINCGVCLLRTNLSVEDTRPRLERLADTLRRDIPCGVGVGGDIRLKPAEVRRVAVQGAGWVVRRGLAEAADREVIEDGGCLSGVDPGLISERACERGGDQLGTLGSGNHFLEIQQVDQVEDAAGAAVLGLRSGMVVVMLHSGSRGFGYEICTDQLRAMGPAAARHGIRLVDRQLACAPVASAEGRAYLALMAAAANYAWANRLTLVGRVRRVFEAVLGLSPARLGMGLVCDVSHNIARLETHPVDGRPVSLCVHRKGATRAFGSGDTRVPGPYRSVGQPVLIPGDMGRASHVLLGASGSAETFGSSCHGAGRVLSRGAAVKAVRGRDLVAELAGRGVIVRTRSRKTLAEEVSEAYKDVDRVVAAAVGAGLVRRCVRLRPLAVVKG